MKNLWIVVVTLFTVIAMNAHADDATLAPKGKRYSYCKAYVYPYEKSKYFDIEALGVFFSSCGATPSEMKDTNKYCENVWRSQLISVINQSRYKVALHGAVVEVSNIYVKDDKGSVASCLKEKDDRLNEEIDLRAPGEKGRNQSEYIEQKYSDNDLQFVDQNDPFIAEGFFVMPKEYKGKY